MEVSDGGQWSSPTPVGRQDNIQLLCQQLVESLTRIMDPSSSQQIRIDSTKVGSE